MWVSIINNRIEAIADRLLAHSEMLAVAESCTGGMIAAACTDVAGSSGWFERGFVTYSNAAKMELLDVPAALLERHGAVSAQVVEAMLTGTLAHSAAQWAIAVSGVAGPDGGTPDKPVGTVYIGWLQRGHAPDVERFNLGGGRTAVRHASVTAALAGLRAQLG